MPVSYCLSIFLLLFKLSHRSSNDAKLLPQMTDNPLHLFLLANEFGKVTEYQINIKEQLYFYTRSLNSSKGNRDKCMYNDDKMNKISRYKFSRRSEKLLP